MLKEHLALRNAKAMQPKPHALLQKRKTFQRELPKHGGGNVNTMPVPLPKPIMGGGRNLKPVPMPRIGGGGNYKPAPMPRIGGGDNSIMPLPQPKQRPGMISLDPREWGGGGGFNPIKDHLDSYGRAKESITRLQPQPQQPAVSKLDPILNTMPINPGHGDGMNLQPIKQAPGISLDPREWGGGGRGADMDPGFRQEDPWKGRDFDPGFQQEDPWNGQDFDPGFAQGENGIGDMIRKFLPKQIPPRNKGGMYDMIRKFLPKQPPRYS